jgi:hypothetical protein
MKPRGSRLAGVGSRTRGTKRWLSAPGCGRVAVIGAKRLAGTVAVLVGLVSVAGAPAYAGLRLRPGPAVGYSLPLSPIGHLPGGLRASPVPALSRLPGAARLAPPGLPARSAASSAWKVQATPNPLPEQGQLLADSCTSSTACTAVGVAVSSSDAGVTLADAWNGTMWQVQKTPNPTGSTDPALTGVACSAASACTAVGSYTNSSGAQVPLAEAWNGTTWKLQTIANPTGSTSSGLYGVACSSASACTAVGSYTNSSGAEVPLAEAWNGASWTVQATPNPTGGTFSTLNGVACSAENACTAVGSYTNSSDAQVTLAEAWNGTTWEVQNTPNPTGGSLPVLSGVACAAAKACTAVGSYNNKTLAEAWNGASWTIQNTQNPTGDESSALSGVACSAANACTAVGPEYNRSGVGVTMAEVWNGTSWKLQATPNPADSSESYLDGVACSAAKACEAVGSYDGSGVGVTLAVAWNGTSWKLQATPAAVAIGSGLSGVACSAAKACEAVGSYDITSGHPVPLAEAWNGTSWTVQATPNPAGSGGSVLYGVACSAADACEAVGYSVNSSDTFSALAEGWNGTSWTVQATPGPTGAIGGSLYGVACSAADACTAVGYYDNSKTAETVAEVWNGASWTVQTPTNPTGEGASYLYGVGCSAAKACTAVGGYYNSSGELTLAETWNGTTWTLHLPSNPTGATDSYLYRVACTAASACTAVGSYDNVSLAETWNGTTWTLHLPPSPTGASDSYLYGVACSAANACTAVGNYDNSSDVDVTLAETWNGTTWAIQVTPNPAGATASQLYGVACRAANACTAVGNYTNSSGVEVSLAEAES